MDSISQSARREIIKDFAKQISEKKDRTAKPSKTVINFRREKLDGYEREIFNVPIELLRYRKDNGRIASNVLDYEQTHGPLAEDKASTQKLIRDFLKQKDPEKTEILTKNILHSGQLEPVIITCDGFLIDGNRRKMVMDTLRDDHPSDDRFSFMKVVILPGENDQGGPPTLLEIEKLENRYQLQSAGKSEYYGFDRALSIRRKIDVGLTLRDQIRDDPQYSSATDAEVERAIKLIEKEYLHPLDCVDKYLAQFQREKEYHTVSAGIADRQGRWQAFKDYSNTYHTKFANQNYLIESGLDEEDIGTIEEAAFDIIRLREIPDMPKVHSIMRSLHKYCAKPESRKELLSIPSKVEPTLPIEECYEDEEQRHPLNRHDVDAKWAAKYKEPITFHLKRADNSYKSREEKETPLTLLEAAMKKLNHKDMDLSVITTSDYKRAKELIKALLKRTNELDSEIYHQQKKLKELVNKKK